MVILVCNNPEKKVYSDNYDKVIYLGYTPSKELNGNEIIVLNGSIFEFDNYLVSTAGRLESGFQPISKNQLEKFYKKNTNQILLNNTKSNINFETETGEKLYYVGKNNHYEVEI